MARRVRDEKLDNRSARDRLLPRGKPYWRLMEKGLHIGYRKPRKGAGKWVVRYYDKGDRDYTVKTIDGFADDYQDADGGGVLNFGQAQQRARMEAGKANPTAPVSAITVKEAVEFYVTERNKRESKRQGHDVRSDASHRLRRYVLGQEARGKQKATAPAPLASTKLSSLEDTDLQKWSADLPDALTAASKQRLINDFKAALNAAYRKHRKQLPVTLPDTIKFGLKAEEADDDDADVPDSQVLSDAQVTLILRAAREVDEEQDWGGDLYRLVTVLAATGARFSQAARLRVQDCQLSECRLLMPDSRKGKKKKIDTKTIPITPNDCAVLRPAVNRRDKTERLLERWTWSYKQIKGGGEKWERLGRGPWRRSELSRPWQAIRKRAGIPEATPYCLRHSSIVRDIRANLPTRLVATKHDTSEEIIRRHYARFITSDLEKLVRDKLVSLHPQDDGATVVTFGRVAKSSRRQTARTLSKYD